MCNNKRHRQIRVVLPLFSFKCEFFNINTNIFLYQFSFNVWPICGFMYNDPLLSHCTEQFLNFDFKRCMFLLCDIINILFSLYLHSLQDYDLFYILIDGLVAFNTENVDLTYFELRKCWPVLLSSHLCQIYFECFNALLPTSFQLVIVCKS